MVKEGRDSPFWQEMQKHDVDLYLCGEVHAITCTERDGIMQVAHGGLIGYNTRTNYLAVTVFEDKLKLEIKEIEMLPHGDHLWLTKNNRPLKQVSISSQSKKAGFQLVGTCTIDKASEKSFVHRKGYFLPKHESSTDQATAIFRKGTGPDIITELPKIVVE